MTHNPVVRLLSILAVILILIIACGESGSGTTSEEIRSTPSVVEVPEESSVEIMEEPSVPMPVEPPVEKQEEPPAPKPEEPTIEEIAAADLDAFYEENERAGDERYKGRMLIVNGFVWELYI